MYLQYATIELLAAHGDVMAQQIMRKLRSSPGWTPMARGGQLYIVSGNRIESAVVS
jgi:hypothetical protein